MSDFQSRLLRIFITEKNINFVLGLFESAKDKAKDRHSEQTVSVTFNNRGHPRHFNGSDNFTADSVPDTDNSDFVS